jgi:oxygen-independent coproporphyrinogen III oxidase
VERRPPLAPLETAGQLAPVAPAPGSSAPLDGWAPRAARLGVYLHVPFCAKRCGYCAFNTAPYLEAAVPRFLRAIEAEVALAGAAPWARGVQVASVFFGGGTPSLLAPAELAGILDALRARFPLEPGAEVTVECNPESVSRERLAGYRAAGVTRVSLGVQSLEDRVLPTLDRLHTAADARRAFDDARAAGFDNVSVDLIYGLPGTDGAGWERTVAGVLAWAPDHLSAYALSLDEGSLWSAAGVRGLPGEDEAAAQYRTLTRLARAAGYEHYEVSNYARPGHRSAHNQLYWRAEEYLAFGPGAFGFLGEVRYGNEKPLDRYCGTLEAGQLPVATHETLTARQRLTERLFLGLRTADGVPATWLEERVALEPTRLAPRVASWRERELLVTQEERTRLTEDGFLLSDALFVDLL